MRILRLAYPRRRRFLLHEDHAEGGHYSLRSHNSYAVTLQALIGLLLKLILADPLPHGMLSDDYWRVRWLKRNLLRIYQTG